MKDEDRIESRSQASISELERERIKTKPAFSRHGDETAVVPMDGSRMKNVDAAFPENTARVSSFMGRDSKNMKVKVRGNSGNLAIISVASA